MLFNVAPQPLNANGSANPNQGSVPIRSRFKHWQQDSTGDGLCPLKCRVTGVLHVLCQCQKAMKEEPQSRITLQHDSIVLAIYKGVEDRIKEAVVSSVEAQVETQVEDSIGVKSNLGTLTAARAQSSQAPLLESANDWKVQYDDNDEGVSVGRSDHSPLRLPLSLDQALFSMVSFGPCRQRQ